MEIEIMMLILRPLHFILLWENIAYPKPLSDPVYSLISSIISSTQISTYISDISDINRVMAIFIMLNQNLNSDPS